MYEYSTSGSTWDGSAAVYQKVFAALGDMPPGTRILDAGCGNGHLCSLLADRGFEAFGVDPSETGIAVARANCSRARFFCGDLMHHAGDLEARSFDAITSIEVIEHVYAPRLLLAGIFRLLKPGGKLILTTPYHGYLKNLALAVTGRFDSHFNPLWDHGHIKFFSRRTLMGILQEAGFEHIHIGGIGRAAGLWKSMFATAIRP